MPFLDTDTTTKNVYIDVVSDDDMINGMIKGGVLLQQLAARLLNVICV